MKTKNNDFLTIVEMAMRNQNRSHMKPVIEKELLHYDILFALDKGRFLDKLTFQGGTSLRLCYGASRFSEDLDFVGGYDFKSQDLIAMKNCLEDYLARRYGLEVTVKEPKDFLQEREDKNINVSIWQLRIVTHPGQRDLPKQLIKIEVANIPAYTREPKLIQHNYDFLPDGYKETILMVETLDEILSDKIVAFINCQKHIRYRDIWDIYWLNQQGAVIKMNLVHKKINDYKIVDFEERLDHVLSRINKIIHEEKDFVAQMSRFLPMDIQERTLLNDKFLFLLSQNMIETLNKLGFEWKQENNGDLYCTNSLRKLTQESLEEAIILMQGTKEENSFIRISYGKTPTELIVSIDNELIANNLVPIHKTSWPTKYQVDSLLPLKTWWVKFA